MKKYIFLLFSFLVFAVTVNAQYKMVITLANGEKIEKQVWDIQNVTFEPLGSVESPTVSEAVDLGLSVKWASCNFGATTETAAGYYVGWGDATGLNHSTVLNYFPVLNPTSDIVNSKYDIVHTLWGGDWRMPTVKEVQELIEKCNWTYDDTRKGWTVTSKADATKSIFLPMQGYRKGEDISVANTLGAYWTGSLSKSDNQNASALVLDATNYSTADYLRYLGLQIRPVYGSYYEGAKVKSANVTNIKQSDAYITVTFEGNYSDASEIGVCYGTTSDIDPTQSTTVTGEVTGIAAEDGTYTFHIENLDPNTTYYFAGYIVYNGHTNLGSTASFTTQSKYPVAEMVDLGLSVKWAKWNIGASSEDEYGSYIAWGDNTGENTSYTNSDYPNDYSDISGTKYDVATTQWGDKWRMPTPDEWKELDNLEKQIVTLDNGTKAYKVIASNGNYIYLPRGGYQTSKGKQDVNQSASYWTSENTAEVYAKGVQIGKVSSTFEPEDQKGWHMLVRPVYGDKTDPDTPVTPTRDLTDEGKLAQSVDLGLSVKWATYNLGAQSSTDPGSYFSWGSTTPGTDFSLSNYQWYNATTDKFNIPSTTISDTDNDAAVQLWGGTWRMPTESEISELIKNCTWTKTDAGFKIKGTNGNEIFLPFTGMYSGTSLGSDTKCYYWSGSYNDLPLHADDYWAYYLTNTSSTPTEMSMYIYNGMCIRPVCTK